MAENQEASPGSGSPWRHWPILSSRGMKTAANIPAGAFSRPLPPALPRATHTRLPEFYRQLGKTSMPVVYLLLRSSMDTINILAIHRFNPLKAVFSLLTMLLLKNRGLKQCLTFVFLKMAYCKEPPSPCELEESPEAPPCLPMTRPGQTQTSKSPSFAPYMIT